MEEGSLMLFCYWMDEELKLNVNLNMFQIYIYIYNKIQVVEQISLPGFDSSGYGSVDCTKRFKTSVDLI